MLLLLQWVLASCTLTKYVPEGQYLLDEVTIVTDNKEVKPSMLTPFVRQTPNAKWFSLVKTQLYVYNWSGPDSTKWANRALRRLGDAPVIYSPSETDRTCQEITKAVQNMGYMGAFVTSERVLSKKRIKLTYRISTGRPYRIKSLSRDIQDEQIAELLRSDSASLLSPQMLFDINQLDAERQRIVNLLRNRGYYKFNKDYISYTADTVKGSYAADLTLHLAKYRQRAGDSLTNHRLYTIGTVNFITDYNVLESSALSSIEVNDSIHYRGCPIYYKNKLYLRPKVLTNNLYFHRGDLYREQDLQRTYSSFNRLGALKYTNIRFFEVQQRDSSKLNAYVLLTPAKHQSVSFELEGTNSAGDLGAAASVSFQHRNIFKGSETFMIKLRGAYEAVSGLQSNQYGKDYKELGAEMSINFPRFMFPFLTSDFKRRIRATSELSMQYNYQMRPEFTRIVASAGWGYKWGMQNQRIQHRVDLLDINYLYMPRIDPDFEEKYLNQDQSYILKYNYDDRLIVRMGYSFIYNSSGSLFRDNSVVGNSHAFRFNIESAGNLLYGLARLTKMHQNADGEYTVLNIPFAQYVKMDLDFTKNFQMDQRNALVFHLGAGVAIPYGNARMLPFEKRYFSGGANSVRGWSVRELGPGSFDSPNNNFLNQTGDIKLDANVEYRTRLFWKFRGAAFIDAGNIWTLRNYEEQPDGQFKFNQFYKQIAVAYGVGLRMDLDFFIVRLDWGWKALNPQHTGRYRVPLLHPRIGDTALHFAVGYPF
ncbi:MAG: BamA/TamA family outer membrane protein [Bacteroides sp.]